MPWSILCAFTVSNFQSLSEVLLVKSCNCMYRLPFLFLLKLQMNNLAVGGDHTSQQQQQQQQFTSSTPVATEAARWNIFFAVFLIRTQRVDLTFLDPDADPLVVLSGFVPASSYKRFLYFGGKRIFPHFQKLITDSFPIYRTLNCNEIVKMNFFLLSWSPSFTV